MISNRFVSAAAFVVHKIWMPCKFSLILFCLSYKLLTFGYHIFAIVELKFTYGLTSLGYFVNGVVTVDHYLTTKMLYQM